jgi:4'-phosphopantetheinyl transferase
VIVQGGHGNLRLGADGVHVWRVSLDDDERVEQLSPLLSGDERERAARFRFEVHRRRYVAAHGALRLVLASYLGAAPTTLRLETDAAGKPHLADGSRLSVNLSHADGVALVAVTWGRRIGVDVERIGADSIHEIVNRFASARERQELLALSGAARRAACVSWWTRKEAYVKALGCGLTKGLDTFDVTLGNPPRLIADRNDGTAHQRWRIHDVDVGADYAAAVAVEGSSSPPVTAVLFA